MRTIERLLIAATVALMLSPFFSMVLMAGDNVKGGAP